MGLPLKIRPASSTLTSRRTTGYPTILLPTGVRNSRAISSTSYTPAIGLRLASLLPST